MAARVDFKGCTGDIVCRLKISGSGDGGFGVVEGDERVGRCKAPDAVIEDFGGVPVGEDAGCEDGAKDTSGAKKGGEKGRDA